MAYDASHALDHPEAAGYALGALDSGDAAAFEEHLASCEHCQAAVAEFTPVASALTLAAPAAEPPPDLELNVVAAVQHAALAEAAAAAPAGQAKARPSARASRWRQLHRANPLFAALAAAAATAAAFFGPALFESAPALAATIRLHAQPGSSMSGLATVVHESGGYRITLTVTGLPVSAPGQFYECWYAGPGDRPGSRQLITAGTFVVGHSGSQTLTMWSAADPAKFRTMQITAERAGGGSQYGTPILSGTAQT
jgi:anti-sigma-K factor RskA